MKYSQCTTSSLTSLKICAIYILLVDASLLSSDYSLPNLSKRWRKFMIEIEFFFFFLFLRFCSDKYNFPSFHNISFPFSPCWTFVVFYRNGDLHNWRLCNGGVRHILGNKSINDYWVFSVLIQFASHCSRLCFGLREWTRNCFFSQRLISCGACWCQP